MILSIWCTRVLAAFLAALLLPGVAQPFQGSPSGSSGSEIEGYLFQAADSVRRNRPLEETKLWCEKALKAVAQQPASNKANSQNLEAQQICMERESDLEAAERAVKQLIEQRKMHSAERELQRRHPPEEKRFLNLKRDIAKSIQEAQAALHEGSHLAARDNCNDRDQVLLLYRKARATNVEIDMSGANKVPSTCAPFHCGGKCKFFVVMSVAVGGGAGTFCYLESRKGKSCIDRVR